MANVELRELQLFELNILKEIDRICKKYDIEYFLAYGSCLGAMRHGGFIPWDDDIDIYMKADEFLRFREICKTELGDKYYLQNHFDDAKAYIFWYQFGVKNTTSINLSMSHIHKPWGICVDIFPLFPYSKDPAIQKKRRKDFRIMKLLSLKYYHVGTMRYVKGIEKLKKLVHWMIPDTINRALFKYYFMKVCSTEGLGEECLTSYSPTLPKDAYFEKGWFAHAIEMDFEDLKLPCPTNCDAYLRMYYGDYMQIPKDKTKHSDDPNVIIKFDECYEKYWS